MHVAGESERELDRDSALGAARLPRRVFEVVREALHSRPGAGAGPRCGYLPALACDDLPGAGALPTLRRDRSARPSAGAAPRCRWCGPSAEPGPARTAGPRGCGRPSSGRGARPRSWAALSAVPVATSGGDDVLDAVPDGPRWSCATPGAEPVAEGGYAAALLLDTWLLLSRADLRAGEEALRRWFARQRWSARAAGGRVVVVGEPTGPRSRRWCGGTPRASPTASSPSARRLTSRRRPGWPVSGAAEAVDRGARGAAAARGGRGARAGRPSTRARARVVVRASRDRGAGLVQGAGRTLQAGRSTRKPAARAGPDRPDRPGLTGARRPRSARP